MFSGCDALADIDNGWLNMSPGFSEIWSYGAVAEFSCYTGFVLSHNISLRCTETGLWNGTNPSCEKGKCQPPLQPINGSIEPLNATHTYLDEVMYSCVIGFDLIGTENRTCLASGEWSDNEPYCQLVDCGKDVTAPVNGNVIFGNETTFGSEAFVNCTEGYRLNGSHTLICASDGTWGPPLPNCSAISMNLLTFKTTNACLHNLTN